MLAKAPKLKTINMKYSHIHRQRAAKWIPRAPQGSCSPPSDNFCPDHMDWGLEFNEVGKQWAMSLEEGGALALGGSSPSRQVRRGPVHSLMGWGTYKKGDWHLAPWLVLAEVAALGWHLEQMVGGSKHREEHLRETKCHQVFGACTNTWT